jgi:predicted Zn-dependent protease
VAQHPGGGVTIKEGARTMPEIQEIEKQARELYQKDQHLEAAEVLRTGLRQHPDSLELLDPLIGVLNTAGEFGESAVVFRAYQRLGGDAAYVRISGARALCETGQKAQALQALRPLVDEPVLTANDGNRAGILLAEISTESSLFKESCHLGLRLAEKTLAHNADNAEAQYAMGFWLHSGWGLDEAARSHLDAAVKDAPERWTFRELLGHVLLALDKKDEAIEAWTKIPVDKVGWTSVLKDLVRLLTERDRMAEASIYLKRLYTIQDEATAAPAIPDFGTGSKLEPAGG